MLSLLYPISYLISLTGLILWFYFQENKSASRKMSALFLGAFFVYLIALAFSESTLSYRLLILARDLAILAAVSQVFNYVRKSAMIVLLAAVILFGFMQFFGFRILYDTFPQVTISEKAPDDTFELLVETKNGQIPQGYNALIKKYNLNVETAFSPADRSLSRLDEYVVIGIPDAAEKQIKRIIRQLLKISDTRHVEYNEVIALDDPASLQSGTTTKALNVNDPLAEKQWGWNAMQGDALQEKWKDAGITPKKKALIAILDTGVDATHEDLAGNYVSTSANYDTDRAGHGTHCAGIAAAVTQNQKGIASLISGNNFVAVTSIQVLGSNGSGTQQSIIKGIIEAADTGADVISLSLGSVSNDVRQRAYNEAVRYANAKGCIVVAAAGNSNMNSKQYSPANSKGIITVAALDVNQQKASFSNTVQDIEFAIAAPGVDIMSTYPQQQYKSMNGTSMATPMVAGLIGVMKSIDPSLTTSQVYKILNDTGKEVLDQKKTGKMIQAVDALEKVMD